MRAGSDGGRAGRLGLRGGPGLRGGEPWAEARYPHVWGWASWRRAWDLYDVELSDWHSDSEAERADRLRRMFEEEDERRYWGWVWDHSPEIDNWDAQWSYVGLSRGLLSINPNRNLISNIGFSDDATNATADPLGIAGRPLEGIDFPLEDSGAVNRDEEADALASRFFSPAPPIWHRVAGRLRRMVRS